MNEREGFAVHGCKVRVRGPYVTATAASIDEWNVREATDDASVLDANAADFVVPVSAAAVSSSAGGYSWVYTAPSDHVLLIGTGSGVVPLPHLCKRWSAEGRSDGRLSSRTPPQRMLICQLLRAGAVHRAAGAKLTPATIAFLSVHHSAVGGCWKWQPALIRTC